MNTKAKYVKISADSVSDSDSDTESDTDSDSDSDANTDHKNYEPLTNDKDEDLSKTTMWNIVIAFTPGHPPKVVKIEPTVSPTRTEHIQNPVSSAQIIPSCGPLSTMFGSMLDPIFHSSRISQLEASISSLKECGEDDKAADKQESLRKLKSCLPPPPNKTWTETELAYERSHMKNVVDDNGNEHREGIWTEDAFSDAVGQLIKHESKHDA